MSQGLYLCPYHPGSLIPSVISECLTPAERRQHDVDFGLSTQETTNPSPCRHTWDLPPVRSVDPFSPRRLFLRSGPTPGTKGSSGREGVSIDGLDFVTESTETTVIPTSSWRLSSLNPLLTSPVTSLSVVASVFLPFCLRPNEDSGVPRQRPSCGGLRSKRSAPWS